MSISQVGRYIYCDMVIMTINRKTIMESIDTQ